MTYGSSFHYAEDNTQSTTTSSTYQEKLKLTTDSIAAGSYIIFYMASWGVNSTTQSIRMLYRVQVDDTTDLIELSMPGHAGTTDSGTPRAFGGFKTVELTAGVHTIDIDFANTNGSTTVRINNARLMLWSVDGGTSVSPFGDSFRMLVRGESSAGFSTVNTDLIANLAATGDYVAMWSYPIRNTGTSTLRVRHVESVTDLILDSTLASGGGVVIGRSKLGFIKLDSLVSGTQTIALQAATGSITFDPNDIVSMQIFRVA